MNQLPYIFITGFNRCGTTSLHRFFVTNGFPSVHWDKGKLAVNMLSNCIEGRKIMYPYDATYRVFSDFNFLNHKIDIQTNKFFRIMDKDYPGSYFIYNTRDMEGWIKSRAKHVLYDGSTILTRSMSVYNTKNADEIYNHWRQERLAFEDEIRTYFSGNDKFVEVDIDLDNVPEKVSALIGRRLDSSAWHHLNKARTIIQTR